MKRNFYLLLVQFIFTQTMFASSSEGNGPGNNGDDDTTFRPITVARHIDGDTVTETRIVPVSQEQQQINQQEAQTAREQVEFEMRRDFHDIENGLDRANPARSCHSRID